MVARMWFNADHKNPLEDLDPLKFGWVKEDGIYAPNWWNGASIPSSCDVVIQRPEKDGDKIEVQETEWSDDEEGEDDIDED